MVFFFPTTDLVVLMCALFAWTECAGVVARGPVCGLATGLAQTSVRPSMRFPTQTGIHPSRSFYIFSKSTLHLHSRLQRKPSPYRFNILSPHHSPSSYQTALPAPSRRPIFACPLRSQLRPGSQACTGKCCIVQGRGWGGHAWFQGERTLGWGWSCRTHRHVFGSVRHKLGRGRASSMKTQGGEWPERCSTDSPEETDTVSCVRGMQPPSHPPRRPKQADEKKFQKEQKRACA